MASAAEGDSECEDTSGLFFQAAAAVLLFFLIMGLAGSVDIRALQAQFHRRLGICCGLLCQFLLMPFIGFVTVSMLDPPSHVAMTLLILCSSSGGAYSNWWCSLFNADLALSVAMTAVSTLCSAAMLPLNLTIYVSLLDQGADVEVPWVALLQSIGTVCLAIVTGVAASSKLPQLKKSMNTLGNVSGICMILLTGAVSLSPKKKNKGGEGATPLWGKEANFYAAVAIPFFVALFTSLMISSLRILKLAKPERVAITIEVCYQNIGIASAVALSIFCGQPAELSDAAAVPIIYGSVQASALAVFSIVAWKAGWTYAPREAGLFHIMKSDFQPCLTVLPGENFQGAQHATPSDGTASCDCAASSGPTDFPCEHLAGAVSSGSQDTNGSPTSKCGGVLIGRPESSTP